MEGLDMGTLNKEPHYYYLIFRTDKMRLGTPQHLFYVHAATLCKWPKSEYTRRSVRAAFDTNEVAL